MPQTLTHPFLAPPVEESAEYAFPPTPVQERIWQLHQSGELTSAWNVSSRFRLIGPLDPVAWQRAAEMYVQQHEALRTVLRMHNGRPRQIVLSAWSPGFDFFDLRPLPEEERTRETLAISTRHSTQALDPTQGPPVRFALIHVQEEEWVFLVCLHLSVCDGWTLGLLSDGTGEIYQRSFADRAAQAPAPALAYGDYSVWLQQVTASPEYLKHLAHWRGALAHHSATRILPRPQAEAPRPAMKSTILGVLLPASTTDAVTALAAANGVTFHVLTMAAFEVLLSAHSGSNDLLFGTPLAARSRSEFEQVPGNFANVLPIVQTLDAAGTFSALAGQVQQHFEGALEHAECRYEHICRLSGDLRGRPVRVLFQTQKDFVRSKIYGNICLQAMPSISSGPLYDVLFFLVHREEGWRLSCEADLARHSTEDIQTWLSDYQKILENVTRDPSISIAALQGLCAVPRNGPVQGTQAPALLVQEHPASPAQVRFHLLEALNEDAVANLLLFGFHATGLLDLNKVTGALRALVQRHHLLQSRLLQRDGEWVQQWDPALFPKLSVQHAQDREQAQTALLRALTQSAKEDNAPPMHMAVVFYGSNATLLGFALHHTIADGWSAGQLAKEFFAGYSAACEHGPGQGPMPASAGNIQFADWAVWQSLQSGSMEGDARMAFWQKVLERPLRALPIPFCPEAGASAGQSGSLTTRLLEDGLTEQLRELALSEGQTLYTVFLAAWMCLLHRYSQEEDIVCGTPFANRVLAVEEVLGPMSTSLLLRMGLDGGQDFLSLVETTQAAVQSAVDHAHPFEDVLAKAKTVQDAGRTPVFQYYFYMQRSFIQETNCGPVTFAPLETLPRSGFAEWELAVIERREGTRLELHHRPHQYSQRAANAVLDDYVSLLRAFVRDPHQTVSAVGSAEEFAKAVREQGPAKAMTPLLTANHVPLIAPRQMAEAGPLLERMVESWRTVFQVPSVAEDADFFALGGHSLLLAELLAQVRKDFGARILAADVLRAPTPRKLLALLTQSENALEDAAEAKTKTVEGIVPVRPQGTKPPVFVISQSLVFKEIADGLEDDRPFLALTMGDDDAKVLGANCKLEEIAAYYVRQVLRAQPHGPYVLGGWCVAAVVAYEAACQLRDAGETVALLFLVDSWAPGHWKRIGPLRTSLARWSYRWQRTRTHLSSILRASGPERARELSKRWGHVVSGTRREVARKLADLGVQHTPFEEEALPLREQIEYNAAKRYYGRPYGGRTLLFKSEEQPEGWFIDPKLGWDALLGEGCSLLTVPGDHARMFQGQGAKIIAGALREGLVDAEWAATPSAGMGA